MFKEMLKTIGWILKRVLYGVLLAMVVCLVVMLFNPFTWGMRSSQPKQPKLTPNEERFIERMESQGWRDIHRYYTNLDSAGYEIESGAERVIDTTRDYVFTIDFTANHTVSYNLDEVYNLGLADYIRDSVLGNSPHLHRMGIYWKTGGATIGTGSFYRRDPAGDGWVRISEEMFYQ